MKHPFQHLERLYQPRMPRGYCCAKETCIPTIAMQSKHKCSISTGLGSISGAAASSSSPERRLSFLAALLNALRTGIQWPFALGLIGHLLLGLLICSQHCVSHVYGPAWRDQIRHVPARFFSRKARSSSSRSFLSFLAALRGFTLPPTKRESQLRRHLLSHRREQTNPREKGHPRRQRADVCG